MRRGYTRYFIGFLISIGLIITLIILLFSGSSNTTTKPAQKLLSSFAGTGAVVQMVVDGPVTAQQTHTQIRITVGRDLATFQQFQGYDGTVVNSKSYTNTTNSFNVFLNALAHAGFTQGNKNATITDPTGYCPLGDVYSFRLVDDAGTQLQYFWTTSCGSPKTYNGNTSLTVSLFRSQIPDYNTLIQDVRL